MIAAVADTHTAIWYVYEDDRLSLQAKQTIDDSTEQGIYVGVSVISLVEIVYLIEKQRLATETLPRMLRTLRNPDEVLMELPIDGEIVAHLQQIPRDQIPDLPDRVIAGTALLYGVPLISRDRKIQAAHIHTIW